MTIYCLPTLLCFMIVVTVTLAFPVRNNNIRNRGHVSKVRLCGDQLISMLRMMCGYKKDNNNNIYNTNNKIRRIKQTKNTSLGLGLGDRCCRSACTLTQLYQAC